VLAAWALVAIVNLSAAFAISLQPGRQTDVEGMLTFGREWLAGTNSYMVAGQFPVYPPNAIVVLSPFTAIGDQWLVPFWVTLNLVLAIAAVYLAVIVARPMASWSAAMLPMLMFLSWGGFRALLQFSLLALVLGLLAMALATRRPWWSGICLGLALMKPHVAAPFWLWALFARRLRVAATALSFAALACVAFCVRVHANPLQLVEKYAEILRTYYLGDPIVVGVSEMRPLVALAASDPRLVDAISIAFALALLAAVCVAGFAERPIHDRLMASAPPLAAVWSLLTFYNLTYGFVLLLPVAALFLFAGDPRTRVLRRSAFWVMQFALMIDVPGLWRRVGHLFSVRSEMSVIVSETDRVLMLALFLCVALTVRRQALPECDR